uniref:Methylmalonyl-CoA mutase n=1 Tax=Candidatus Kentrum sp. MB TaxID=2138164 RepID=A0A450XY86_9GAMM|nr:MAG: Methylmalonyl-CoA mutase [Candidatus Kentron sp. MB]VFK34251.1 MAG: Methylmalonyl-CoA mutase [Candidatus Kentron sp. MB]VFK76613.1 MAG: Methylmalonyl-CoA mutase [Candidatus Kentron sp. MB]
MNQTPAFTQLDYDAITFPAAGFDQWKAAAEKAAGKPLGEILFKTMEHVDVKPLYTKDDIAGFPHLGYVAGIPPYFRGPYPSMYVTRPWTVRKSSRILHEESNAFYRRNLAAGQMGLSIAFDLATQATTPTMSGWLGTSARPGSPSTPWQICILLRVRLFPIPIRKSASCGEKLHTGLHLSAGPLHPHHRRHLQLHHEGDAQVQQHQHLRLSHAGSESHRRHRTRLHPRRDLRCHGLLSIFRMQLFRFHWFRLVACYKGSW